MNNINKYFAEQLGVQANGLLIDSYYADWTISDPRCREVIREKFGISTIVFDNGQARTTWKDYMSDIKRTIAEAEIACLTAIYEARDDN